MSDYTSQREAVVEVGRRLDRRGLIAGSDGNISVRLDAAHILVTPSGAHKGRLASEDLVIVDPNGAKIAGERAASSESAMHLFVYRHRPDIGACVHAHPPHATAFAVAGLPLAEEVLPEVVVFAGQIALTEYAPPGTEAVPRSLEPFIADHDCFLLANHGVLTIGRDLEEAYNRLETVEQYAKILLLARQLGEIRTLPADDLARLKAMRDKL